MELILLGGGGCWGAAAELVLLLLGGATELLGVGDVCSCSVSLPAWPACLPACSAAALTTPAVAAAAGATAPTAEAPGPGPRLCLRATPGYGVVCGSQCVPANSTYCPATQPFSHPHRAPPHSRARRPSVAPRPPSTASLLPHLQFLPLRPALPAVSCAPLVQAPLATLDDVV